VVAFGAEENSGDHPMNLRRSGVCGPVGGASVRGAVGELSSGHRGALDGEGHVSKGTEVVCQGVQLACGQHRGRDR
jgi:hypothetical protein